MAEIFYSGAQAERVTVRQGQTKRRLDPRYDLRKHPQRGFAWGIHSIIRGLDIVTNYLTMEGNDVFPTLTARRKRFNRPISQPHYKDATYDR